MMNGETVKDWKKVWYILKNCQLLRDWGRPLILSQ